MKTSADCIPCLTRQISDACQTVVSDPERREQLVCELLFELNRLDKTVSPPALAQRIHRRLRKITGIIDPYAKEKELHNQMAMELLPDLRRQVESSKDPLMLAAHMAIAGNIIDLGAKSGLDHREVLDAVRHAAEEELRGDTAAFRAAVENAQSVLYLADNCGEIVFDTLLIEQIGPERITLAVRGMPIINDATIADAKTAGLDGIVPTIGNGSDAPGTILEDCSPEFIRIFNEADLVISKGQGNYETLNDCAREIFFLFKVKCEVVSETSGQPVGTHVLLHKEAC